MSSNGWNAQQSFEENREKPLEFVQFVVNLLFFEWGLGVLLSVVH